MFNCHKFGSKKGRNKVFGLDKSRRGWYNKPWATDRPKGRPYGAVAFLVRFIGKVSFHYLAFPEVSYGGEVIELYMTWEVFFLFCTVVIDLLALVVLIYQNNKKK